MRKISLQLAIACFSLFILVSGCANSDYEKTESGIVYKIVSKGKEKLKPGQWIKINYRAMIGDSAIFDTYDKMPAFGQFDTTMKNTHDFIDFLGEMGIGDSAIFIRSIDSMQARGYLMFNDVFKKGGTIKGYITILDAYESREAMAADQESENTKLKENQVTRLEAYLKEQKVEGYIKTPKGVFVKIETEGTGPKADSGMLVTVKYTGKLKNGNKFDSNVDTAFGHTDPFSFTVNKGEVIEGWDDGIKYFKQGGKGKIYIPSMLGYGGSAQGDKIPPFSDLIFDMEILEVKAAGTAVPERE